MFRSRLLAALESRRGVLLAVMALLSLHAGLLAWSATRHSPTFNEPAHLAAGLSHWQFGRFELYRVNPPLVRMVAALPVLTADVETDWSKFHESAGARPVFSIGEDFVAANGERSLWIFTIARWACIPFSLLGGYICFRWGRELFHPAAGLLALTLWCFSPNVLAHGELITPDMGATALGLAASYFFWRWLKSPTWSTALAAGAVLGLAELTKFTWIILFGLWPVLWLVWRLYSRTPGESLRRWRREAVQLAAMFVLAIYLINLGYGFEGSFTKLGDFSFVSKTLKGHDADSTGSVNRFAGLWLESLPVPLPRNYVSGIDVQKRDFEDFGRPSYLRGEFRDRGWWYYYLYAALIKIPLGTWVLILFSILCCVPTLNPEKKSTAGLDTFVLLLPAIAVFTLVSSQTGFSHHFRYVIPTFPFVFIWIGRLATVMFQAPLKLAVIPIVALLCTIGSSLSVYPHSLSYFNEAVGGPTGGHKHLINSNIDWGQDLKYLKRWLDKHPEAKPFHLAYYGYFDPQHIGIESTKPLDSKLFSKPEQIDRQLKPGWYAVSVNFLKGYPWHCEQDAYSYFQVLEPTMKFGHSIYLYHVDDEDVRILKKAISDGNSEE